MQHVWFLHPFEIYPRYKSGPYLMQSVTVSVSPIGVFFPNMLPRWKKLINNHGPFASWTLMKIYNLMWVFQSTHILFTLNPLVDEMKPKPYETKWTFSSWRMILVYYIVQASRVMNKIYVGHFWKYISLPPILTLTCTVLGPRHRGSNIP